MITTTLHVTIQKILLDLPIEIRKKFARPKHPELVYDFLGTTELELLHRCVKVIDMVQSNGFKDGNWYEYVNWIGFDDSEMEVVHNLMIKYGYTKLLVVF